MNSRFAAAMSAYAVLGLLAGSFLTGQARVAVWIFLGGLAAKTLIAVKSRSEED